MDEIQPDDGGTAQELGRDPWLHTDWQDLFERITGSSEPPLSQQTLSQAVSNKYDCNLEFGDQIVEKAAECGQLLRVRIRLGQLYWDYYFVEPAVINGSCNWIYVSESDVLPDRSGLDIEPVSRDEFASQLEQRDTQVTVDQAKHIAAYVEHFEPLYAEGDKIYLEPHIIEFLLMSWLHNQITESVSFSTPTTPNEALAEIIEIVSEYREAKDDFHSG